MTEYQIKLASALPKEAGTNGWDDDELASALWHPKIEGREITPRVAILIYGAGEAKVDKKGVSVVSAEILRVQPVFSDNGLRAIEAVLLEEYRGQTGEPKMATEVEFVTRRAFRDLPRTPEEIDEMEAAEQDLMSPTDELRKHGERVHGWENVHLMTPEELNSKHDADHDGGMPTPLTHDRQWIGWTRVDIEAAEAASEDDGSDDVISDEAEAAAGGPDPDYSWDLDDEDDPV